MADPQAAAQRLRAYLNARPGAVSLGGIVEYGPEFTAANGRPAGVYALDRADLEAVLSERDRLQQEVQHQIDAKMGVAGDWGNALADRAVVEQAIARLLALHQPYRSVYDEGNNRSCAHCNQYGGYAVPWPCDTIQALNGEQP